MRHFNCPEIRQFPTAHISCKKLMAAQMDWSKEMRETSGEIEAKTNNIVNKLREMLGQPRYDRTLPEIPLQ